MKLENVCSKELKVIGLGQKLFKTSALLNLSPLIRPYRAPSPSRGKEKAFTLIELLVVVLIIGILAAIAVPQYQKAVYKARITETLPVLKAIASAQEAYYLEHGAYTNNIRELDVTIPAELISTWNVGKFENKYSFSCGEKRTCAANIKNKNLPIIEFELLHDTQFPHNAGKIMCHNASGNKSARAMELCASLGVLDEGAKKGTSGAITFYTLN